MIVGMSLQSHLCSAHVLCQLCSGFLPHRFFQPLTPSRASSHHPAHPGAPHVFVPPSHPRPSQIRHGLFAPIIDDPGHTRVRWPLSWCRVLLHVPISDCLGRRFQLMLDFCKPPCFRFPVYLLFSWLHYYIVSLPAGLTYCHDFLSSTP